MDTKARIGLFAGGLVLVGMVAYVMMPRAAAPQTDGATASADATPATGDLAVTAPTTRPAATQPVAVTDPFAEPEVAAMPGAAPAPGTAVEAVPAVDGNDAWARALDTGSAQTHSGSSLAGHTALVSEVSTAAAPAAAAGQKTYKIEAGDSFASISTKLYGSSKYANKIMAANPSVNAKRLKIGQEIKLLDIAAETAPAPVASASASHASPLPMAAATVGQKTYKVQSGDTLTKISTRLYGKSAMWTKLYAANKSKIGADPTHLRAGMVLQIPDNVQ